MGRQSTAETQAHIFERFFRGTNGNHSKTSGSGLGLAIARSIAETLGGKLTLIDSGPEGTTFELALPVFVSSNGSAPQPKSLAVKM